MERKGDFISNIRYKEESEIVTFQGKEITLENLSPVFTPEQEAAKRRELEQDVYKRQGLKSQPGVVLATSNLVGLKMGSLRLELGS